MNLFNFFKRPIIVHCYTADAAIYNYAPIKPASKFIPAWWKALPKSTKSSDGLVPRTTMKGCVGFTNLYKKGFILPMWSDLAVLIGEQGGTEYKYQFSCGHGQLHAHPAVQRGSIYPETEYQHLKISSPWYITCNEPIDFLQVGVPWDNNLLPTMQILPGVLEYKYQGSTNINTVWKRESHNQNYMIEHGTPLCQFIPLTEREIKIKLHLISKDQLFEMQNIASVTTFLGKYKTNKRLLKARGCPFHFKTEK